MADKNDILSYFFKLDESSVEFDVAEYRPLDGIQVQYNGEIVDSIEFNDDNEPSWMYVNQDRESGWFWDELTDDWTVYKLTQIEL